jgi:Ni,Fe-hydrogenase III component G
VNGLRDIVAANAAKNGKQALMFTVYVSVDPEVIKELLEEPDPDLAQVVGGEIQSNLESVAYVDQVIVRQKF